jgi:hypothetical protein
MWFEGKWMQLEDIRFSEVQLCSETQRPRVLSYVEDRFKRSTYIQKQMIIYKVMQNMFVIVELLYEPW